MTEVLITLGILVIGLLSILAATIINGVTHSAENR